MNYSIHVASWLRAMNATNDLKQSQACLFNACSYMLQKTQSDGGFTFDINGDSPKSGYMVSLQGFERTFDLRTVSPADIAQYIRQFYMAAEPNTRVSLLYVGGWIHDNKLYLDLSANFHSRNTAIKAGKDWGQIGIWDVENSEEIIL